MPVAESVGPLDPIASGPGVPDPGPSTSGSPAAGSPSFRAGGTHESYLAAIVESSEDAIVGKDLDAIITSWNPGAERLYGYSASEAIGRSMSTIVPPERPDELPAIMERLRRGERVAHYETVRVRKDGARLNVSVSIAPIRNADGTVVGAASITRDVTVRRRFEDERAALLAREQESRARAERTVQRAASLEALAEALAGALTSGEIAAMLGEQGTILGADASRLYLVDVRAGTLHALTPDHTGQRHAGAGTDPLADQSTPAGAAARRGEPVLLSDRAAWERAYPALAGERRHSGYEAAAAIPLVGQAEVLGVLEVDFAGPCQFDDDERGFLLTVGRLIAQALERARLLEAERASREQFDAILGGMADGVLVQDGRGSFVYANPAAARMAGFDSTAEFLPSNTFDLWRRLIIVDADGRPFPLEELPARRALRGEPTPEKVVQFRRLDTGEVRWSLTRARAIRAAGGERIAISLFHDITERIRSEERLKFLADVGAALTASLDMDTTLESVARIAARTLADLAVVFLLDEDRSVRTAGFAHRDPSRAATMNDLVQRYPLRAGGRSQAWRAIETGRSLLVPTVTDELLADSAEDVEHLHLLQTLGFSSALYVPFIVQGRTIGAIGLYSDESRRRFTPDDLAIAEEVARRAALALDNARLYRNAQDAVHARDEFLSIASHELRTPVTALSGVAQLLRRARRRGILDDARLDRALDQIAHSSARLSALTEDLLDVSRLQSGHFKLRPERLDLVGVVRETVEQYREQLDERYSLRFHAADAECSVCSDPTRLEQVIENLLGNAAKYSPEGGPIEVTVERDGGGVRLDVRDHGIGLPPGTEGQIFRPFGRAPNAAERQIQGLGLGLYICRQIVERHDGRIWATSDGDGQGTTMSVWLPCAPLESGDGTADATANGKTGGMVAE
ncbi:MAG: PAS domain S-box protein [Chloroflexi bacterium]|nr:PAS domain S-box protein [Chloroflexota bacterium]